MLNILREEIYIWRTERQLKKLHKKAAQNKIFSLVRQRRTRKIFKIGLLVISATFIYTKRKWLMKNNDALFRLPFYFWWCLS
jgi:hypothetical protein